MLIASQPSSSPSRRVLNACRPSRSTSAIAAAAIRSRDSAAPEFPGGRLRDRPDLVRKVGFGFVFVIIGALKRLAALRCKVIYRSVTYTVSHIGERSHMSAVDVF